MVADDLDFENNDSENTISRESRSWRRFVRIKQENKVSHILSKHEIQKYHKKVIIYMIGIFIILLLFIVMFEQYFEFAVGM